MCVFAHDVYAAVVGFWSHGACVWANCAVCTSQGKSHKGTHKYVTLVLVQLTTIHTD